jgi:DNA modification methylase
VTEIVVGDARVVLGDCRDVLRTLADNSVDSVVTDPPYEIGFMGRSWDGTGVAYDVTVWEECLRVLKPGGHILAFGGSRTWHRLAVAVEDAGFEIRDSICWLYGSGFPKSLDVSKAIDKKAGAEREVVGEKMSPDGIPYKSRRVNNSGPSVGGNAFGEYDNKGHEISAPSTAEAQQWSGWGTALKPAFEPIVVGRKPFGKGVTVAENVLAWGVGGLNIDASRIGTNPGYKYRADKNGTTFHGKQGERIERTAEKAGKDFLESSQGRWPANVILDEVTAGLVDKQSGVRVGMASQRHLSPAKPGMFGVGDGAGTKTFHVGYDDIGGASRFFYQAKASKRDRNEGLEGLEAVKTAAMAGNLTDGQRKGGDGSDINTPTRQNFHPTVKPTQLMRYLIKLVTPPGGTVLDPFTGSGSTGKAALLDGFKFVGAELTEEYLPIIEGRLRWALEQDADVDETLF